MTFLVVSPEDVIKDNNTHGQPYACHAPITTIGIQCRKVQITVANLIQHGLGHATNNNIAPIGLSSMEMHIVL